MAKRRGGSAHYERLFETILRDAEILYIAIDESKRPIYAGKSVKNFDFIVSSFNGKFLIDIKGKTFPYGRRGFWENWITSDDISGLKLWSSHFNAFIPLIVFIYRIVDREYQDRFEDLYEDGKYGIVAVDLATYYRNAKTRSKKWDAISISRDAFQRLAKPISSYIPELRKKW